MNKKLFNQIRNEWRSNLWLAIELLLVSVLMWVIVDFLYLNVTTYYKPLGFNIEHCYNINYSTLDPTNPHYDQADTIIKNDYLELASRIRQLPYIEAASINWNAYPYSGGSMWSSLQYDTLKTENVCFKSAEPGFFRIFKYQGANGESPEQLTKLLADNPDGFLMSANLFDNTKVNPASLVDKMFYLNGDSSKQYRLLGLYKTVRYSEFSTDHRNYSVITNMNDDVLNNKTTEISIRVKAGSDIDFVSRFWQYADKHLHIRNLFISDVKPLSYERDNYLQQYRNDLRIFYTGAAFFLLNLFLGLFGTFWFRTQQERGEIALFKVMGGTNRGIFIRQLSKALLLLTIATIPAIIIDWNIAFAQICGWMGESDTLAPPRFIPTVVITYLVMALTILLGAWLPARKAMKVQPAEALHDE